MKKKILELNFFRQILTVHTALNAILLEYTSSFEPCHYCACEAKSVPVKI